MSEEKKTIKWSVLEVLKGKTFPVLVLVYVVRLLLQKICLISLENQMIYLNDTGISIVSTICYLPALVIGVLVVWLYQNQKDISKMMIADIPLEELERREKKFKWHGLYSILIGFTLWGYMIPIGFSMGGFAGFVCMIGTPLLVIVLSKPINKTLLEKTETNKELIEEFSNGVYNACIPEDLNTKGDWDGVLEVLEKGEAHTIRGAFYVRRFKKAVKKVASVGGVFGTILGVILFIVTFGVANNMGKAIGKSMSDLR